LRILVIDDSEDCRDLTEAALLSAGYDDVVTGASGWDALKILDIGGTRDNPPAVDLMVADIVMPDMDGIEACARIRNDERYADLPIIMATSLDDEGSLANAFMAGANDYITKPLNRVELLARVRSALRLKAELDRRRMRERELLHFMSNWSDRRAGVWIDEVTGLFVGEVAEAYLAAMSAEDGNDAVSVLAICLDRFEAYRCAHGENAAGSVLAQVAQSVRRLAATVGIVAAAYPNGTIVLIAPEFDSKAAREFGDTLNRTISKLRLPTPKTDALRQVTASIAVITGRIKRGIDRAHLLTQAIAKAQDTAEVGGNRVLALTA
jgi:sigma-B regulation protein RsbU (phosphoserine phosphatase)